MIGEVERRHHAAKGEKKKRQTEENGAVAKTQIEEQKSRKARVERRRSALADKVRCGVGKYPKRRSPGKIKTSSILRDDE